MGLATRIIPTMLVRGRQLIKGEGFHSWRSVGLAQVAARIHAARGVDELLILDIGATAEKRGPDVGLVSDLTANFTTPITVGGGVNHVDQIKVLLDAGADKVCIGTAALETPYLIEQCAKRYGSQAIAVTLDHFGPHAFTRGGSKSSDLTVREAAKLLANSGAGELILQCIDRDGRMVGYDLETIHSVSSAVSIPVVASGGCRDYDDMGDAIMAGADAVAAGALFQFTDATPRGAAEYLSKGGINVRIP